MKSLVVLLMLCLSIVSNSQNYQTVYVNKQVVEEQSIKLNNGFRATFGGVSRQVVPINLPANTESWSYVFSTTLNEDNTRMFADVAKTILKAGATAITSGGAIPFLSLMNSVPIPSGSSSVSVYILDANNVSSFIDKKSFNYIIGGTVEQQHSGKIVSQYVPGQQFYIGIQNTSSMQRAVYVKVQVFANVKERQLISEPVKQASTIQQNNSSSQHVYQTESPGDVWTDNRKQYMLSNCKDKARLLNLDESKTQTVAECMLAKIIENNKFYEYQDLYRNNRWDDKMATYLEWCKKQYMPAVTSQSETKPVSATSSSINNEKAVTYGRLGWQAFESGDIDKCIELTQKAVAFDNSVIWLHSTLGLCYLYKKDETKAIDYYVDATVLAKNTEDARHLQAAVDAINKGVANNKFSSPKMIRDMLQKKLDDLK